MKKLLIIVLLFTTSKIDTPIDEPKISIQLREVEIILDEPRYMDDYLNDIGHRESSNRYNITNRYGYMGKYQFGMSTLKTIGIKTTREEFLSNPRIQETAMLRNLKRNKRVLKSYIDKYSGTLLDTVYITESGILAAAHIGGANGVKNFFDSGIDREDGNKTKLSAYLVEFSGYNLKQIQ